jgi:hypothetical protein
MSEPADTAADPEAMNRRVAHELEWARWAVSRWAAFPVERQPRPLVLVGQRAFVEQGFTTGDAKLAYVEGRITALVSIPDAVLLALPVRREGSITRRADPPFLQITDAGRSETDFRTDRGRLRLPAWRLQADGVLGPIWVLDPETEPREWRLPEPPPTPRPDLQSPRVDLGARVELGPDEFTLTVHFMGALPQYEQYPRAEVIESAQAVAIVPIAKDVGSSDGRIRVLPGHTHQVTVRLEQPLGDRVFVDLDGNAREVLTRDDHGRSSRPRTHRRSGRGDA